MESVNQIISYMQIKFFGCVQSLNFRSNNARQELMTEGTEVLKCYHNGKLKDASTKIEEVSADESIHVTMIEEVSAEAYPTGSKIAGIVTKILSPVHTLEVTTLGAAMSVFVLSNVVPRPFSWMCTAAMLCSLYAYVQISHIKRAFQDEIFFFERRKMEQIDPEELIQCADACSNRLRASCSILETILAFSDPKATTSIRDMGGFVQAMIDSSDDPEGLQRLIMQDAIITALFRVKSTPPQPDMPKEDKYI